MRCYRRFGYDCKSDWGIAFRRAQSEDGTPCRSLRGGDRTNAMALELEGLPLLRAQSGPRLVRKCRKNVARLDQLSTLAGLIFLKSSGISCSFHYEAAHMQPAFRPNNSQRYSMPGSRDASQAGPGPGSRTVGAVGRSVLLALRLGVERPRCWTRCPEQLLDRAKLHALSGVPARGNTATLP